MTNEQIINLAFEHTVGGLEFNEEGLLRFVQIIDAAARAAEREECAKVCDAEQKENEDKGRWLWEAKKCAASIRARGNT